MSQGDEISIFISYSHHDINAIKINNLLKKRVEELQKTSDVWADSKIWWDEQIPYGVNWWRKILREITDCSHFIYMLSRDSVVRSPFCPEEHNWAIKMERKKIYVKTDENLHILPNGISRFQIIGLKKNLNDTVTDIIQAISTTSSRPPLPKNHLFIPYPSCPPYKLSELAEKVYHFNEEQDGDFVMYHLWRFIREDGLQKEVIFLAEILREKVQFSQYRDDIDEILSTYTKEKLINPPPPNSSKDTSPNSPLPEDYQAETSEPDNLPSDLKEVIQAVYHQSVESADEFMNLWSIFRDCFVSEEIDTTDLVDKLSLEPELADLNSLVTDLVENPKFLLRFISEVNDIIPEFALCMYNSCKQFIGELSLVI